MLPAVPLMPSVRCIVFAFELALRVGTVSCAQQPPATKQEVLASLADHLIVPRFQQVAQEMADMDVALSALSSSGSSGDLTAARAVWREVRALWFRSQAMRFSLVMDRRSRSVIDWRPVESERIEKLLSEQVTVATGDVREFFASTRR